MSEKLKNMKNFYEFFPYPGRPFFLKPIVFNHLNIHLGYQRNLVRCGEGGLSQQLQKSFELKKKIEDQKSSLLKKSHESLQNLVCDSENIALVGSGTDEPLLFRKLHPNNRVYSFDLSQRSLMRARLKVFLDSFIKNILFLPLFRFKNIFIQGDASLKLLEYKSHFSYIQCFGVLHHQPRPEVLFKSITDSLSADGILRLMIYSYHGRRLERRIQRKYDSIWSKKNKVMRFFLLMKAFFSIYLWRILKIFSSDKSLKARFQYLGLFPKPIADAFLHPSDAGLSLETLKALIKDNGYELISFEVHIYERGHLCKFHKEAKTLFEDAILEDKKGNLLSNPIFVLKKNALF